MGPYNENVFSTESALSGYGASPYGGGQDPELQRMMAMLRNQQAMQGIQQTAPGVTSGQAGIVGSLGSAIYNKVMLDRRKKRGVQDITPASLRDVIAESGMRANSGRVSNFNERLGQINVGQTGFLQNAAKTATSPQQLQQMLVAGERGAGAQRMQLGAEGAASQRDWQRQNQGYRLQKAEFEKLAQDQYNQDVAAYRNAIWQNINNAVNAGGQMKQQLSQALPMLAGAV